MLFSSVYATLSGYWSQSGLFKYPLNPSCVYSVFLLSTSRYGRVSYILTNKLNPSRTQQATSRMASKRSVYTLNYKVSTATESHEDTQWNWTQGCKELDKPVCTRIPNQSVWVQDVGLPKKLNLEFCDSGCAWLSEWK